MIAFLKGIIIAKKSKSIILLVNNIGYEIFISEKNLSSLTDGAETSLYIHHHVKEDGEDLYGFLHLPELELFKNLISISGVGPKSALSVLATASVETIIDAILSEDPALLKSASGIGQKTAERIVVELKSKIGSMSKEITASDIKSSPRDAEVIEALLGLGYSRKEIMEIINKIPNNLTDTSARIKAALQNLAR